MTSGIDGLMSILLSYPLLTGSIIALIISTTFLLLKGKQMNKFILKLTITLFFIAFIATLFLAQTIIAFGNPHPSASPIPLP